MLGRRLPIASLLVVALATPAIAHANATIGAPTTDASAVLHYQLTTTN